jgi:hypothetical protein
MPLAVAATRVRTIKPLPGPTIRHRSVVTLLLLDLLHCNIDNMLTAAVYIYSYE